jgi:hypothetical protein
MPLKTVGPERVPGVRIPPPPPFSRRVSFSALETARNGVFRRKIVDFAARKGLHSLSYFDVDARQPCFSLMPKWVVPFQKPSVFAVTRRSRLNFLDREIRPSVFSVHSENEKSRRPTST